MGFDVEKIYLLRSAIEQIKDDENCVYWNGKRISLEDLKTYAVKTKPSPGWEGLFEKCLVCLRCCYESRYLS